MNNPTSREELIAALTDGLTPIRRVRPAHGAALIAFATLLAGLAAVLVFGLWSGLLAGQVSAFFWITNGLLALLGAASTAALVSTALPRVGARSSAPWWSAAMLGVIPAAAIITLVSHGAGHVHAASLADPGLLHWECTAYGLIAALVVAAAAVAFLRRGAPVSLERAGWLTGLASGALGSLAYGITCPHDTLGHVGLWHTAPVALAALACRFAVPPLIRW
ncbi:MAG: DUF1109 domain-containing protein [Erythrobacter sp.]|jgi:hypothetical protein|nr:DUF1109 domain-containing protein [Erythrobacter sp.]